ncbi:uncharacterized protein TRIVIDRAFT_56831 [Trichoderma virens Gv29-8]|uniref:Uncharacterized protein n=1 Tax=Hypocrea virens (strain Gv29-8 / FGSC 10586) TaxID=413071 RepID=G9NA11_HYPVG|nr:uncharacterized protein TRIVIDRAFT_56831 [Trichoderma virens Gv29-8]EHK16902.1 hypothetical protein TRIVIDRAFT_56831 [Trichoderma virens Gv29-8]UKZ51846.1 hypothetical protein TrVGV298_005610 [Trichoderma virens]
MSYTAASIFLILTILASSILARPPDITFLCNEVPEICTNMCWAVRCAQPSFPQTFTIDPSPYGYGSSNKTSISASCPVNDMCGTQGLNQTGHRGLPYCACNAYPLSVTSEDAAFPPLPQPHRVSRCVPEAEQCIQRSQLELFAKRLQQQSGQQGIRQLSINFGNPGGIKYCNNDPCVNDGFEVQDGRVWKKWRRFEAPMFTYYKTKSGIIVASLEDMEVPSRITRRVGSGEVVSPGFRTWFEQAREETVHMMEDTIVQRLSDQAFGAHPIMKQTVG